MVAIIQHRFNAAESRQTDIKDCRTYNRRIEDGLSVFKLAIAEGVTPNAISRRIRRHRQRFGLDGRTICTHEHPEPNLEHLK